jgi:GT2 family glycosyltransferase
MDLAIVIATRDRAALLARALASIEVQHGVDAQTIVVDDGSTDDTDDVLRRAADESRGRLRYITRPTSGGPAAARNMGWPLATTEWIAFTDDDCEPDPSWASALLEVAQQRGADIVQGRTLPNPSHERTGCWDRSARVEQFSHRYQTCNLLVRRSVLEALGGFDGTFPFAGEDADFGWRAQHAGFVADFADAAVVHHAIRPCSFRQHLRDRAVWADLTRFFRRHPEARFLLVGRLFYRRSHVVLLAGAPLALAMGLVVWWMPLTLGAAYIAHRAHGMRRTGHDLGHRLRCAGEGTIADAWEIVQFVRASVRHRTIVL